MSTKSSNGLSFQDQYIYLPSTTDITLRWRKMGWLPPSEDPKYKKKWYEFRKIVVAGIESIK